MKKRMTRTSDYTVYYRKNPKNKIYFVIDSDRCLMLNMLVSKPFQTLNEAESYFRHLVLPQLEGKFKEIDQTQPVPAVSKRRS